MNKDLLRSVMIAHGDTQAILAEALGIGLSTLNAKINEKNEAGFKQTEIAFIKSRYNLSADQINLIFFAREVS